MTTYEKYPHPIDVRNHLIEIRVKSSIYMETGALDHYTTAFLNPNIHKPSYLHYTPTLTAEAASSEGKMEKVKYFKQLSNTPEFQGETSVRTNSIDYSQRDEGATLAAAFGCETDDLVNQVTVGGTPYFDGPYCPSSKWGGKRTAVAMPPSIYGSKLQMYLQAIWGSKRDVITLADPVFTFLGLDIEFQNIGLPHAYDGSTWLYTAPDSGRYYLINVSSSFGFLVKNILLSDNGDALRVWLKENPQDAETTQQLEAYILSTGTPEPGWWIIKSSSELGDLFDKGSPFSYGLHANWDGDEARAVCIQRYDTATYGDSNPRWESTYQKITISLNSVAGPALDDEDRDIAHRFPGQWTVSVSTIDNTVFTGRTNETQVFYPSPATGQSVGWVPKGLTGDNVEATYYLYCTYDIVNDAWTEVTGEEANLNGSEQITGPINTPFWDCGETYVCETQEIRDAGGGYDLLMTVNGGGGGQTVYGGENGGINADAEGGTLNHDQFAGAWQLGDDAAWALPQRCELGDPDREIHRKSTQTYAVMNHFGQFQYSSEWLLALPYNCIDAFYAGHKINVTDPSPLFIWNDPGCRNHSQSIMHGQGTVESPTATSGWILAKQGWISAGFHTFSVYSATTVSGCDVQYTSAFNHDEIKMELWVGDTSNPVPSTEDAAMTDMSSAGQFTWPECWDYQPVVPPSEGGTFDDENWTLMFDAPLLLDPFINQILFVNQSVNGNFFADRDPNGLSGSLRDSNYDYDSFDSSNITYIGWD